MTVKIELQGDTRGLRAVAEHALTFPSRRAKRIAQLIQEGVEHNYQVLTWGGAVTLADGSNLQWSRVRSRMTVAIRASRGLSALFPLLTLTGKLGAGLANGGTSTANGQTFSYAPAPSIRALVATHQLGLQPLPSQSSRAIFRNKENRRVPARPILFWSRQMQQQVITLAAADVKGGAA